MFEHMLPLIAVAIFGHACNGIALADEKKPDAVQIVALDDSAISITTEDLRKLPRTSIEVLDRSGKKVGQEQTRLGRFSGGQQ